MSDNTHNRPVLGLTMGDPAGIGAEIAVKALDTPLVSEIARTVIIGARSPVEDAIRMVGSKSIIRSIASPRDAMGVPGTIDLIDLDNVDMREIEYGKVQGPAGRAAFEYIKRGIELALEGSIDAVVTGPIHKEALNLGGYHYSGHTEIFADLTDTQDYAMMLLDGGFRVSHVSTHVSLATACARVKKPRVLKVIQLTHDALATMGVKPIRIAVAGLNPHAGEQGMFGDEEIKEIRPAIEEALAMGMNVDGPIPPDTVFAKMRGGQYDAVVVMYHDQGHIPLKTIGFDLDPVTGKWTSVPGVNTTLGLPIIRTSVDHGTAFGKAGKGTANAESLINAIELAVKMAAHRRARS